MYIILNDKSHGKKLNTLYVSQYPSGGGLVLCIVKVVLFL